MQVAGALDAGLALGRGTLEALASDLAAKRRLAAERLARAARRRSRRWRWSGCASSSARATSVAASAPNGQVLVTAGGSAAPIAPERPARRAAAPGAQRTAWRARSKAWTTSRAGGAAPRARVRALALVPSNDIGLVGAPRTAS